jgi:hypothetical protein
MKIRYVAWFVAWAYVGGSLIMAGQYPPWGLHTVIAVAPGLAGGGLIGIGFAFTFVPATTEFQRRVKIVVCTISVSVIGGIVGYADPGVLPIVKGVIIGGLIGAGIGLANHLTSKTIRTPTGP